MDNETIRIAVGFRLGALVIGHELFSHGLLLMQLQLVIKVLPDGYHFFSFFLLWC